MRDEVLHAVHAELRTSAAAIERSVSSALNQAVAEMRLGIKRDLDLAAHFAEVSRAVSEKSAWILNAIEEIATCKAKNDVAPVMKALQGVQSDLRDLKDRVDVDSVAEALWNRKAQVDFTPVLHAIHGVEAKEARVDFAEVLREIRCVKKEVDFSPVLHAIQAAEGKEARVDFSELLKEIRAVKKEVDLAPVVNAIHLFAAQEMKVDSTDVLQEIRSMKAEADANSTFLLEELQRVRSQSDLTPVVFAIRAIRPEVDLSPVLVELQQLRASLQPPTQAWPSQASVVSHTHELDARPGHPAPSTAGDTQEHLQVVLAELRDVASKVDLDPLLAALRDIRVEEPLRLVLAELRGLAAKADANSTFLLEELQRARSPSDLTPVVSAIRSLRPDVDLGPVLVELQQLRASLQPPPQAWPSQASVVSYTHELDVRPGHPAPSTAGDTQEPLQTVLAELRDVAAKVDLGPLLSALREIRVEEPLQLVLAELRGLAAKEAGVDVAEVLREIRCVKEVDFSPVLHAIQAAEGKEARVDFSELLEEIRAVNREVDLTPVVNAIHDFAAQEMKVDPTIVLQEIRSMKEEVLVELQQLRASLQPPLQAWPSQASVVSYTHEFDVRPGHPAPSTAGETQESLQVVLAEMRDVAAKVDLGPLLAAVREIRVEEEPLQLVLAELRGLAAKDDPLQLVLAELREVAKKADVGPVVEALQEIRVEVDNTEVLDAIAASRMQADISPLVDAVKEIRVEVDNTEVLNAIRDCQKEAASASVQEFAAVLMQELRHMRADLESCPTRPPSGREMPISTPDAEVLGQSEEVVIGSPAGGQPSSAAGVVRSRPTGFGDVPCPADLIEEVRSLKGEVHQLCQLDFSPMVHAIRDQLSADILAVSTELHRLTSEVGSLKQAEPRTLILDASCERKVQHQAGIEVGVSDVRSGEAFPLVHGDHG